MQKANGFKYFNRCGQSDHSNNLIIPTKVTANPNTEEFNSLDEKEGYIINFV